MSAINCSNGIVAGVGVYGFVWGILGLAFLAAMMGCYDGSDSGAGAGIAKTEAEARERDWEKFIYECISKVENSDAVFYRRGKRVAGRELAGQMRGYLKVILRMEPVPEPFGRDVGVVLAMITTHEGIYRDGLTGRPEPFEIEVGGQRTKVYDWLKQQFGLEKLPGEEVGHEAVPLYEAVLTADLLRQWEEYLDRCIEVTKQATDCRFHFGDKTLSSAEVAGIFASNRVEALERLKQPNIKHPIDKENYTASSILISLTAVPPPRPESVADRAQYGKEVDRWVRSSRKRLVEHNGTREGWTAWLLRKAGEPPPMPKLKKKGKGSG